MYQQSLFVKNAGLLQDQSVKPFSEKAQVSKYQLSSRAVPTASMLKRSQPTNSVAVMKCVSTETKSILSPQTQSQNRYQIRSLNQPNQYQMSASASNIQRRRLLPVMARASTLNPSLALNRSRAPQPAMLAQGALFTVQNNTRFAVKQDHMDKGFQAPRRQKSLVQRAVAPGMYYGYGYDSYPYGYNFGNRYGYGGMGGYGRYGSYGMGGYGGRMGYYGMGNYGGYGMGGYGGYGMGGYGGRMGYYGMGNYGGYGMGGYGGRMGYYGMGNYGGYGMGGFGPYALGYRSAYGMGGYGGYGYGRYRGIGGWRNYTGLPLGLGASFEECI